MCDSHWHYRPVPLDIKRSVDLRKRCLVSLCDMFSGPQVKCWQTVVFKSCSSSSVSSDSYPSTSAFVLTCMSICVEAQH
eukprot:scaffold449672_cov59-Attheya_sp.AAC.2